MKVDDDGDCYDKYNDDDYNDIVDGEDEDGDMMTIIKDPEWPSGLVPVRHVGAPGSLPGRVGLSEIKFSDLYCGWLRSLL